jgi:hypothetical protein
MGKAKAAMTKHTNPRTNRTVTITDGYPEIKINKHVDLTPGI